MTDQQRATASHLYGNSFCQTPAMARLAEEGILYQNAITPHPLCCDVCEADDTGGTPLYRRPPPAGRDRPHVAAYEGQAACLVRLIAALLRPAQGQRRRRRPPGRH